MQLAKKEEQMYGSPIPNVCALAFNTCLLFPMLGAELHTFTNVVSLNFILMMSL